MSESNRNTDRPTARERRRKRVIARRRARELAEIIATNTGNIKDLKEKRPPETAIRTVQNLPPEPVETTDSISVTTRGVSPFVWDSSVWGQAAWGESHVP